MATAYSTLLGLALPVQGELSGTWGTTVNEYITNYLDAAVAGTQTLSTDADVTLTKTTGTSLGATSSQYAVLNCTGARTAQRTITAPAASKTYAIINATTGGFAVKLVGAGPTTGITIANGEKCLAVWNGSDFTKVALQGGAGSYSTLSATGLISTATAANSIIGFQTQNSGTTGALATGTSSVGPWGSGINVGNSLNLGTTTASSLVFATNNVGVAQIDTSGNLGLGVTPSGWSPTGTQSKAFEVKDSGGSGKTSSLASAGGDMQLSNNAYYNGSGWVYVASAQAANYYQSAGTHVWRTAPSGTAGNAITFTERLRIAEAGQIGIGGANYGTAGQVLTSGGPSAAPAWVPPGTIAGVAGYSTNTTLNSTNYGQFIYVNGTFTLTLPVAAAGDVGKVITVYAYTTASVTVATQSSQTLYYQGTSTATSAVMLGIGDSMTFINYNGSAWMAIGSNSIGVAGQTWQNVTGSRTIGTTYTNTTGKPIMVSFITSQVSSGTTAVSVGGTNIWSMSASAVGESDGHSFIVPTGQTYVISGTNTLGTWAELR